MKTIFLITVFLACLCASCTKDTSGFDKEVVIVIDITDPLTVKPDEQDLYAFLGLASDIWQGIRITVTSISETDINQEHIVILPKGSQWMGNTALREAKIARFKKELHEQIHSTVVKAGTSMGHSIVYRTLSKELDCLSHQSAQSKSLFEYGDLMENDSISFYSPETFSVLSTNPTLIQKKLERSYPIGSLLNVSIYCLFSPSSYNSNYQYMVVAGFFKRMFESKSAQVHFCNSIN